MTPEILFSAQPMISKQRRESIKGVLLHYPLLFRLSRAGYIFFSALQRELIALGRYAPQKVFQLVRGNSDEAWQRELPVQGPRRIKLDNFTLTPDSIEAWCRSNAMAFYPGGDSIYLPPSTFVAIPLDGLSHDYPLNTGLKIARTAGTVEDLYLEKRWGRSVAHKRSFPHRKQMLTFNYLHLREIAPRLYDLVEIVDSDAVVRIGYVVEHIDAEPPREGDCKTVTGRLKELETAGRIELISGARWTGIDFEAPDCNGNLRRGKKTGRLFYVDVHNFILNDYAHHLTELATSVAGASHFGGRSRILGGTFLYQEIPGVELPAKRSPRQRMQIWDRLMREANVQLENKVVFDVGCNLGLMGAEYLRRGARWLHGWDMPEVVEAARQVLLSIGCTRFSLTGNSITSDIDLKAQLPEHLTGITNDDAILNYLAIRGHVGWLPALADLPWRCMFYEGHQDDGDLGSYIDELSKQVPVRLVAAARVADAVSASRDVAIIQRLA